ncbi:MAG: hypothetical protein PVS2B1_15640 [Candidatus Dormibacteraceae bacterium]
MNLNMPLLGGAFGLGIVILMDVVALAAAGVAGFQFVNLGLERSAYLAAPHCSDRPDCIADVPATVVGTYETAGGSKTGPDCRVSFETGGVPVSGWYAGRCVLGRGNVVSIRTWRGQVVGMTTESGYQVSQDDPASGWELAAFATLITVPLAIGFTTLLAIGWRRAHSRQASPPIRSA